MDASATDSAADDTAPASGRIVRWLRDGGWVAVGSYLLAQAGLLFWWAASFPGLFSPDSIDYIWQSTTSNWSNHHSVPYTALVWLSLQVTGGVAALTLGQVVTMALGVAYLLTGLRRFGVPGWALLPAAALVAALPPVGTFFSIVWKDVAFVIAVTFLVGTLVRMVAAPKEKRGGHLAWTLLVEALLIGAFRQNGFLIIGVVAAVAAVVLAGVRLKIVVGGVAAIAVALGLNLAILPALGVKNGLTGVSIDAFVGDIAVAYRQHPETFTAEDKAVLETTAPLDHWATTASCLETDATVMHLPYNRDAANANHDALMDLWWRVLKRTPGEVIGTRWCRGSIAWSVTPTDTGLRRNPSLWSATGQAKDSRLTETPFPGSVVSKPLDGTIYRVAVDATEAADKPGVEWIAWRGATLAYLTYAVIAFAAWRRRDPTLALLAVPTLAVQLSVLAVNSAQAARYMAPPYVLGVLLLPLLFVRRRPAPPDEEPVAPAEATEQPALANA